LKICQAAGPGREPLVHRLPRAAAAARRRLQLIAGRITGIMLWAGYFRGRRYPGLFHMPKSTPATLALRKLGIAFKLHTYVYDSTAHNGGIGLQAAEALGVEPGRMLKTLLAEADGTPVCVVLPSDCEGSMKKLAAALAGRSASRMRPADAGRPTG